MNAYNFYMSVIIVLICSCCENNANNYPKILFLGDSVKLYGAPDSSVLGKFISDNNDATFLFNNMVSMSLILEPPAIYHYFIMEHVGGDKQISYMKMEDALKYNWIPPYDSLSYDLCLDFSTTEAAGCVYKSKETGEIVHTQPDTAMKWSSKYIQIPLMRKKSADYYYVVSECDDIDKLADYYNHSLFFQNNSFVSEDDKTDLLNRLICITQIQCAEYFFDLNRPYYDILPIIVGQYYNNVVYSVYKINNFALFKNEILNTIPNNIKNYENLYHKEHLSNNTERLTSRYLLDMNSDNLNNIISNIDTIQKLYYQSSMMFVARRPHEDLRLFFFNIKYNDNNKIIIKKNYFNKEYITTTKIRGYYIIM